DTASIQIAEDLAQAWACYLRSTHAADPATDPRATPRRPPGRTQNPPGRAQNPPDPWESPGPPPFRPARPTTPARPRAPSRRAAGAGRAATRAVRGAAYPETMDEDLFSLSGDAPAPRTLSDRNRDHRAPLAVRMRPRSLDEVVGQHDALEPGSPLRR